MRVLIQGLPDPAVTVDDEGVFRERRDTFAEVIDGVKEKDLRKCAREDCQGIFLAKKPNQQYCNPKCTNIVKNRRFRLDQKESAYRRLLAKKRAERAHKRSRQP
jgi:CGNR zinc finger